MTGTNQYLDQIRIELRNAQGDRFPIYIDVYDNSLSLRWLAAVKSVIDLDLHLEKNYCFLGFPGDAGQGVGRKFYRVNASTNIAHNCQNY